MARKSVPKSRRQYVSQSDALAIAREGGAKGAPFPKYIEPLLATGRDRPPRGDLWVHEIKYDGYRVQLHKSDGGTSCYTRRGFDWSNRFPTIIEGAWGLKAHAVVLDGEAVVLTDRGDTNFSALESYVSSKGPDRGKHNIIFIVFDLLYLDGMDLRDVPLIERKRALKTLLEDSQTPFMYSEHLEEDGPDVLAKACDLELEGVVSKRRNGKYRSGRNDLWTKVTCRQRETFVIAGIALKGAKFDGVYLGRKKDGELVYAGKVENGFNDKQVQHLKDLASKLKTKAQPFAKRIKKPKAEWLKPVLRGDVEYRRMTTGGLLRHPSYKGLRED